MAKNKTRKAPAPQGGNGRVEHVQALRGSGAAGSHGDRRTKRGRTRAAQKARALAEW